jgi:hypothetical protein
MKSADRLGFGAPDNRMKSCSRLSHPVGVHASGRDARSMIEETKEVAPLRVRHFTAGFEASPQGS